MRDGGTDRGLPSVLDYALRSMSAPDLQARRHRVRPRRPAQGLGSALRVGEFHRKAARWCRRSYRRRYGWTAAAARLRVGFLWVPQPAIPAEDIRPADRSKRCRAMSLRMLRQTLTSWPPT